MRTTISLDDGLAEDIRRHAAEERTSVSALIERLLKEALHRQASPAPTPPFRLVTVSGGGLRPGVDLDRAARLIEDEDEAASTSRKSGR